MDDPVDIGRVESWARGCFGKKQHTSKGDAQAHIDELIRKNKTTGLMDPYRCNHCPFWHVGHRRGQKKNG